MKEPESVLGNKSSGRSEMFVAHVIQFSPSSVGAEYQHSAPTELGESKT
jgi:hypothetical protein